MPRLQKIKRSNGSLVYNINIPLEIIEQLDWEKGDDLTLEIQDSEFGKKVIIFKKKEVNTNDTNF